MSHGSHDIEHLRLILIECQGIYVSCANARILVALLLLLLKLLRHLLKDVLLFVTFNVTVFEFHDWKDWFLIGF